MIKACSITFQKLMTAGYISAETYHFLSPKKQLSELSLSELYDYEQKYKSELLPLFDNVNTYLAIAYLEKLDNHLMDGDDTPYEILNNCLRDYPDEIECFVNDVGKREFLQEYIYCTEETLKTKLLVSKIDTRNVISFRDKFRSLFQLYCNNLEKDESDLQTTNITSSGQSESLSDVHIKSGEGFDADDFVSIENDAISMSNIDCKKYVFFLYSLNKDQLAPVIEFLIPQLKSISVRIWNGIKTLGYREFLINYLFAEPMKLLNLRNMGRKSLFDFEKIKPIIIDYVKDYYICGDTKNIEDILKLNEEDIVKNITLKERIGLSQYKLVAVKLSTLLDDASVRSRNGIQAYKGDFIEDFVNKNKDIKNIRNIGIKSESEIKQIIEKLRKFVETMKEREFSEEEFFLITKQSYYRDYLDEYAHDFYYKNGHLPMFHLLEGFFRSLLTTNRDFQIYNLRTPIFKDEESQTMEDIAEQRQLTRERVRQIYMKVRKYLCEIDDVYKDQNKFSITNFFENKNDWSYVIDDYVSKNYIDIYEFTGYCNQENHHFTDEFMFFLVGTICREQYVPIGKPILPYPTRSSDEWDNCYLIKRELTDKFDFIKLFELIDEYKESNTEVLVASARELIIDTFFSAWIDYDSNIVEEISDVVSNLLIQELGIIPDDQFHFTIEGQKEENVSDIIYDILKSNGDPLTIDELYQSIDRIYPNRYKSSASIKSIIGHDSRLCSVGENNLVALIDWDHVKIGSIRTIIVQFLEQYDEPKLAKDIVSYVQKYRDTTYNSIRSTMASGSQFVQFRGGYFGLSWKQYPEVYSFDKNEQAFFDRIQEFDQFLQEYHHFPFYSSNPQETVLHEWWINIKSNKKLSKSQTRELKMIEAKYKDLPKKKKHFQWIENCKRYSNFIQINHRRPSMDNPSERDLYMWFHKAAGDFANGTLTQQQELFYLELCKSF